MEDFNNYQQSGIISGLDNETVSAMKAAQTNWNDAFKEGATTDTFKEQSVGENMSGIANGIANSAQLINSVITPNLVSYTVSYVTNVLTSYMTETITSMVSFDGSAIISYAGQMMPNYLLSAGDILNNLLQPRELLNDLQIQDLQNKLFEQINNVIGDKIKVVTDKINTGLEKVAPAIADISYYSQLGPAWVQSKIDLAIAQAVETPIKGMTEAREAVNKQKEELIKNIGNKMGKQLADKTNKKIKETTKDKLDKVEKTKAEAMAKAKTLLINVKLKLFAIIGA